MKRRFAVVLIVLLGTVSFLYLNIILRHQQSDTVNPESGARLLEIPRPLLGKQMEAAEQLWQVPFVIPAFISELSPAPGSLHSISDDICVYLAVQHVLKKSHSEAESISYIKDNYRLSINETSINYLQIEGMQYLLGEHISFSFVPYPDGLRG